MKVIIDPRKTVYENAADHYEKSKKYKKKIKRLEQAIQETEKKITKRPEKKTPVLEKKIMRKKEWYEKYHWFFTRSGKLVLAGKDARSNQDLVRKHLKKNDLFAHADVHGAPATIFKDGQSASEEEKKSVAQFAACYSRIWGAGVKVADAFIVKPEQVKTAAKAGEYLAKGAFVITGERQWFRNLLLELKVSYQNSKLIIGPPAEIPGKGIIIAPGPGTKHTSAKQVLSELTRTFPDAKVDLDWIMQILPNGGSKIIKQAQTQQSGRKH